jgi:DNA-binding XRE family transcriptional regulator
MLAVVKTPHTEKPELEIWGQIPDWMISRLKKEYGRYFILKKDICPGEDEFVDVFKTEWFSDVDSKITPGESLRIYRENAGLSQVELGKLLGNVPRQNVSAMEKGRRGISKEIAKKLSSILKVPVGRFV